jgi:hypothetical protein
METVGQAQARPRRGPLLAVLAGVVGVAVVAGVVATRGGGGADPDEALADAAEALEAAGSYRMSLTTEDRVTTGEAGGPGSDTTTRTVAEGEVSGDDWRIVSDSGDWADESVGVGGRVYSRFADDTGALAAEPWVVFPTTPPPSDEDLVDQLVWMAAPMDDMGEIELDESGEPPVSLRKCWSPCSAACTWAATEARAMPPCRSSPAGSGRRSARSRTPRWWPRSRVA